MPKIFKSLDETSIIQASLFNSAYGCAGSSRYDQANDTKSSIEFYDQLNDGPLSVKYFSYSDKKPKKDRYNFVFLTFFLYGVSSYLPWNVLSFANEFFINSKLNTPISYSSLYRKHFVIITTIIWHLTFLFSIIINFFKCDR
jgi:hypothetical protein